MTIRKRRSTADIGHTFQRFLFQREVAATATKEKEKAAKDLRKFTRENGAVRLDEYDNEVNGGNIEYALDAPIQVGDKVFAGMELRKSRQIDFDEEAALALAKKKKVDLSDVVSSVTITLPYNSFKMLERVAIYEGASAVDWPMDYDAEVTTVVNQDAFYVLNQQGKINDEELDSLLVEAEPKYAFWPIERAAE